MNSCNVFRTSQRNDVGLQRRQDASFLCWYGYCVSPEAREHGEIGQDFLAFRFCHQSFHFVLCDGVGLSFRGDVAARLLGSDLLEWLDAPEVRSAINSEALRRSLAMRLEQLTVSASRKVEQCRIPKHAPALLRDVLEYKRQLGSEAMFLCGRLDRSVETAPPRITLAWMGDIRAIGWTNAGTAIPLVDSLRTEQRWSSHRGAIEGGPNVLTTEDTFGIQSVLAYTDGLSDLDGQTSNPSADELRLLLQTARRRKDGDDAAVIHFSWQVNKVGKSDRYVP